MKKFLKLTGASLKMTYRERMALFWMFFFPLLLMLLLGTIFGHSGQAKITVGVVDLDHSPISQGITSALKGSKAFTVLEGSRKELINKVSDGKANAVLIFNKGFFNTVTSGKQGKVTVYVDR
jgi:ABC-2 type transport system permease protein